MIRAALLALLFSSAASAQTPAIPRTPDGHPDLQGVWASPWLTPLERQPPSTALVLKPEDVAAAAKAEWARQDALDGLESLDGFELSTFVTVRREMRSSIIIDPPDGRLPMPPDVRARYRPGPTGTDDPEQRGLNERCLTAGNGFAPIVTAPSGNIRRIVQTQDHVVIYTELMSQLRIIPTDGRSTIGARRDTMSGHWEGDTLVIVTTGIADRFRGARGSNFGVTPATRITERLTRTGPAEIAYTFTVEDPSIYTRPWTGETVMVASSAPMFEFACHEGNYGLANILLGARVVEERAASKAKATKARQ